MLLNELFPFIFRNAKGELEFVKLVDARWDKKYTLEQKIDLELMATVDLVFDMIPKKYYLTHKGSEKAMCSLYDKLKNLEQINASSSKSSLSSNINALNKWGIFPGKLLKQKEFSSFWVLLRPISGGVLRLISEAYFRENCSNRRSFQVFQFGFAQSAGELLRSISEGYFRENCSNRSSFHVFEFCFAQ